VVLRCVRRSWAGVSGYWLRAYMLAMRGAARATRCWRMSGMHGTHSVQERDRMCHSVAEIGRSGIGADGSRREFGWCLLCRRGPPVG
jgi:hypothetical protein